MAASFTQLTICSTASGTVTGTTSCRNFNDGYAAANTSDYFSLTGNRLTLQQGAEAVGGYNSSSAFATDKTAFSIGTAGLIRQGFVQGYFSDEFASNGGQGSTVIHFDGQTIDSTSLGGSRNKVIYPVAIQLGTPVLFQSLVKASGLGPATPARAQSDGRSNHAFALVL